MSLTIKSSGKTGKSFLIVLDGFGIGKNSLCNAIDGANMAFYKSLLKDFPHTRLWTHGEAVGLPRGVMGNSEVGHTAMGVGRIVYQDLVKIQSAIDTGDFFENDVLKTAIRGAASNGDRLHFLGLLSDGGIHSHEAHLYALLDFAVRESVPEVSLHLLLDGRDTPPKSSLEHVKRLMAHPAIAAPNGTTKVTIASIQGRFYGMDRDKRWERIDAGLGAICGNKPSDFGSAEEAIVASWEKGKNDEFVEPISLVPDAGLKPSDTLIFFNYRADRAREISQRFAEGNPFTPKHYITFTEYEKSLPFPKAYPPQTLANSFSEILERHHLKQFRVAETEKYAHVTFFFNGGVETPRIGEERLLVASPREVETYDLKPEMSAPEVARQTAERLTFGKYDFVLLNFANADMVGHTGNYAAALKAMEALDKCLNIVVTAAFKNGYDVLITADHGNAEEMCDHEGHPNTQHTLNPVPAIWVPKGGVVPLGAKPTVTDGSLIDIMPTLCRFMNLEVPKEVTGKALFQY